VAIGRTGDTIFAPATAPGRAGIAVIRVSGPEARQALAALSCKLPTPRRATRARFIDRRDGETIDDGIALYCPSPASVTGEDVVEVHLHGGRAVLDAVISVLSAQPGFRLAEPGEFTRRAFEHGKLDLTAAEAVADLVAAETAAQRRQALRQLEGRLGALYDGWRARLLRASAYREAAIDFADEELPEGIVEQAGQDVAALIGEVAAHLSDDHRGEIVRDGVSVAIVGPPNVGKSSLLNALAKRDVAITSAIAGTTRDVIEVRLDLKGYPVIVADTAGLREARDSIEAEGVRRARARAEKADLVVVVLDISHPEEAAELGDLVKDAAVVVLNKADLAVSSRTDPVNAVAVSAITGEGIPALIDRLASEVERRFAVGGAPSLTRTRHRAAVEECLVALRRSTRAELPELAAEDLRLAMRALGRITGRVDVEDLLDIIFRDFCIGK
jgi:tRNA modification GTPase